MKLKVFIPILVAVFFVGIQCKSDSETKPSVEQLSTGSDKKPYRFEPLTFLDADGNFVYPTGNAVQLVLADGSQFETHDLSTEFKLVQLIERFDSLTQVPSISLTGVSFKNNSAELKMDSEKQLKNLAQILKAYPAVKLNLSQYSDGKTSDQNRAQAVLKKLIDLGVEENRLTVIQPKENTPICPENDSEACRAMNRRIEIIPLL